LPVAASHIPRLAAVASVLGEGAVGLFVDHPTQVKHLSNLKDSVWPGKIPVFIKLAAPSPRAGLHPESSSISPLVQAIASASNLHLVGAYAHIGESYASNSPAEAIAFLGREIRDAKTGADRILQALPSASTTKLTISLGATPTATAVQNTLMGGEANKELRAYIEKIKESYHVEIHAGVYPVLDMQQLATRARPAMNDGKPLLSTENLSLRVLVEVASTYDEREKPEALVAAGSIVFGREPCKSYPGWGVVTPWTAGSTPSDSSTVYDPEGSKTGWIVGRISQEHGNLVWEGPKDGMRKLEIGEKVMVWPNHACMAGPSFGYYLVVDGESSDPDRIQDVWARWRGW
jgi:D-serine deaminase-like pyridoxal phosphate-dependent protein